ncbi:uncharacterized protein BJ171DRAFT_157530 [Polychytrium aggregatum]|uniref:uncharacterized protein n=1 Tax=Polychytrium aggregatum TaxID=110093 RepID=UPI0022FDF405|nr:uncharacterized protein BJ171DRAFT_157530 [Polychytrium aggregatum]KAI9202979.1 hypothetical protein BJ171DRAFT_157530 [Polychytrium aggregatum]
MTQDKPLATTPCRGPSCSRPKQTIAPSPPKVPARPGPQLPPRPAVVAVLPRRHPSLSPPSSFAFDPPLRPWLPFVVPFPLIPSLLALELICDHPCVSVIVSVVAPPPSLSLPPPPARLDPFPPLGLPSCLVLLPLLSGSSRSYSRPSNRIPVSFLSLGTPSAGSLLLLSSSNDIPNRILSGYRLTRRRRCCLCLLSSSFGYPRFLRPSSMPTFRVLI